VHIASLVSVAGGGELVVEDYAGISAGCRLVTGTDDFLGGGLTGPTIPSEFRSVTRSLIILRKHALLGTGVIVHPGVEIGEGAVVGSGSLVLHDVPPWSVNVGSPCKVIKERPHDAVISLREELERKYHNSDGALGQRRNR
jgi:galactoside O-acetyltransferase